MHTKAQKNAALGIGVVIARMKNYPPMARNALNFIALKGTPLVVMSQLMAT